MKIVYGKKRIDIKAKKTSFLGRFTGLMFKSKETDSLLFDFNKEIRYSIHSLFVFFPFLAVWMDKNNRVAEYKIIKPFSFNVHPKNRFKKLAEIPLNSKNIRIVRFFVGKTEKYKDFKIY